MARKTARPGRTLAVFFVGTAILYGLVAAGQTWKPALGLDLEGGTRITLTAKTKPTGDSLKQARQIIDNRVNGSGVTEAQVTTQNGDRVIVEIPGKTRADLVAVVERQAQLRFRLVACSLVTPGPCDTTTTPTATTGATATAPPVPGAGVTAPAPTPSVVLPSGAITVGPSGSASGQSSGKPSGTASGKPTGKPSGSASAPAAPTSGATANRPAPAYDLKPAKPTAKPSGKPTAKPSGKASASATGNPSTSNPSTSPTAAASPTAGASTETLPPSPSGTGSPSGTSSGEPLPSATSSASAQPSTDGGPNVGDPLTWINAPDAASIAAFNKFQCPANGDAPQVDDVSAKPLVTCDDNGIKYLLSSAAIEGTSLKKADYGIPPNQVQYAVTLQLGGKAKQTFADISRALVSTGQQFAIVLDGQVISAPGFDQAITNGDAQITGSFTEQEAKNLATSLKFGALPIAFTNSDTETIGPSLAGDQLTAGITAGIVGLALVMIYCLIYYRGLGLVVVSSLLVAGGLTYAMVLLLANAGFTLSLPGIAGLIVAVGITADSFIVYFERIRDEMRDGKSMRVAVEAGWVRARNTCLAADAVSLLAAVVLYVFAAGVVKGFAFTLGLSTVIDLVVFFFFTKPFVSSLARYRFFNRGHKLSGLDAEALGVDRINLASGRA